MEVSVTKFQILTNSRTGNPLFYCHQEDQGHQPIVNLERERDDVRLVFSGLMKIKDNRQTKDRVDVYMSVDQARGLGSALIAIADTDEISPPRVSNARPHDARRGRMELPHIVWSRFLRTSRSAAKTDSELRMQLRDGWLNVDFEMRHETHVKMGEKEIHLGISLAPPVSDHVEGIAEAVMVPESELRRPPGRPAETNPVSKIPGAAMVQISRRDASGLGHLLRDFPVGD